MYRNILVAYDGSEGAKLALKRAIELGREFGSKITALWVRELLPHYPETIDEIDQERESANLFQQQLQADINLLSQQADMPLELVSVAGNPPKAIVEYAGKYHIDLVVMGHKGHSNLWGNLLGHITDKVSSHAPCSVLIIRK